MNGEIKLKWMISLIKQINLTSISAIQSSTINQAQINPAIELNKLKTFSLINEISGLIGLLIGLMNWMKAEINIITTCCSIRQSANQPNEFIQ